MKIAKKALLVIWSLFVVAVVAFYCFSAIIGYQVKNIALSAIESQGTDFAKYDEIISQDDYVKLWHTHPDEASFDRIIMKEQNIKQQYSITRPYILAFKDINNTFSFNKVGYIYDNYMVNADGTKGKQISYKNSNIVLDLEYNGLNFKITKVYFDNDFHEYKINGFHGIWLAIILTLNGIARNIRYFDYCVVRRRKRNKFRLIQPYIFVLLVIIGMITKMLPIALIIGIIEEIVFTLIYTVTNIKDKTKKASQ